MATTIKPRNLPDGLAVWDGVTPDDEVEWLPTSSGRAIVHVLGTFQRVEFVGTLDPMATPVRIAVISSTQPMGLLPYVPAWVKPRVLGGGSVTVLLQQVKA